MTVSIYALVDADAGVRYIGQTVRPLAKRLAVHWQTARAGERTHRAAWMRVAKANGVGVSIELLAVVGSESADSAEVEAIAAHRASGCLLTNTTDGGGGVRGLRVTDATRRKMSESASRRKVSVETRARMSAAMAGKYSAAHMRGLNLGRVRSVETRRKMSRARRGEGNGMATLTWPIVREMRDRFAAGGMTQRVLAREYGVSGGTVSMVLSGKTWVEA